MFLERCKEMVQNNISKPLDEETLEIMQYVVAALVLVKEKVAIEKLPSILKELDIYAENKTVLEMAHEYLQNYQEDNDLAHGDACVCRSLLFEEDGSLVKEKRTLLISTSENDDIFEIIEKLVHEFMHLLRFGGIEKSGEDHKIRDGISVTYYNPKTGKSRRKHRDLEEGTVQKYTNEALHALANLLREEHVETIISKKFLKGHCTSKFTTYLIERTIIEKLCQSPEFNKLLDESFTDHTMPSPAIKYYNTVMRSSMAFADLERQMEAIKENILDLKKAQQLYAIQNCTIDEFIRKSKLNRGTRPI